MDSGAAEEQEEHRALARMSLMGKASSWLATNLNLEQTLRSVTRLPVPTLADGCVVQLVSRAWRSAPEANEPLQFDRLVVAHVDSAIERRVNTLASNWAHALHRAYGAQEVLRTGELQHVEDLRHEPGGEDQDESEPALMRELNARAYVALPLTARGQLIGVLTLVRSEPSHPERDAALAADHTFLAELSLRASAAIDNARLYHKAQQAIAVRDDVLTVVTHDLQSPLNAISMTVKRLVNDPQLATGDVKRALELIERTTRHIGQLIAELLEVGSIQAGRLVIDARPTSLAVLIGEALAILEPMALDRQLQLTSQLEPRLPRAQCDGERVMRVLMNLIGNAIKFTDPGGEVGVRARTVGEHVEVCIRDTGTGIAREDLPKLFDPYWRSRQAGRRGMGLGLYIARGIIEAHGGHIWVESELGVGSSFCFRLAIAPGEGTYPR